MIFPPGHSKQIVQNNIRGHKKKIVIKLSIILLLSLQLDFQDYIECIGVRVLPNYSPVLLKTFYIHKGHR